MATKFQKINGEWMVKITCSATGSRQPEIGDIVKVNHKNIKVTEVVSVIGTPETYGCEYLVRFVNF